MTQLHFTCETAVDKTTENDFKEKELEPFSYMKKGKQINLSYYQSPEEVFEDSDMMIIWANKAYSSALSVKRKK